MLREIEIECPSCSPKEEVGHQVLKEGHSVLVRCLECGQVHPAKIKPPKASVLKVVVSKMDISRTYKIKLDSEIFLHVDDEIVVDDEEAEIVFPIMITALDAREKRVKMAKAEDINTIWGRYIDEVTVKFSAQSGTEKTAVIEKCVPGDYEFVVGAEEIVGNTHLFINKIKVRDGEFRSRKGDVVLAKYVKRIFARKKGDGSYHRAIKKGPW